MSAPSTFSANAAGKSADKPRANGKTRCELLIAGGLVLPLPGTDTLIDHGGVAVNQGRIVAVGASSELEAAFDPGDKIDASGCLVLPGLVNSHTHAAMTLFRGLADDLPLHTWLHQHIFPAESRWVNEEHVYWGSLLAMVEMIKSGTTTVADGYFCEAGAAAAALACGIRAVVAQGVIDFPAPGVEDPGKGLQVAAAFVDAWKGRSSRLQPSLFCHAPYTCSPETIAAVKELCRRHEIVFQIHLAETEAEAAEIRQRFGSSPTAHLHKLAVLDRHTLCHHAVWLDNDDVDILAATGAAVSHNPESNMKLAAGVAPIPELVTAGVRVGLGTDGCASNNDLDMLAEMDMAAKLHKVMRRDPTILDARTVLRLTTSGGAAALGLEGEIGTLEPGKKADLVVVDLRRPHLTPMYEPHSHLVYAARGADVRDVVIDGQVVMRERRVLTVDAEEVMASVRSIAARIHC